MILHQFRYRNRKLGCFTNSIEVNTPPDVMRITLARQLVKSEDDDNPKTIAMRKELADCELVYFGTFDDADGKYELLAQPELVMFCGDYIQSAKKDDA